MIIKHSTGSVKSVLIYDKDKKEWIVKESSQEEIKNDEKKEEEKDIQENNE